MMRMTPTSPLSPKPMPRRRRFTTRTLRTTNQSVRRPAYRGVTNMAGAPVGVAARSATRFGGWVQRSGRGFAVTHSAGFWQQFTAVERHAGVAYGEVRQGSPFDP